MSSLQHGRFAGVTKRMLPQLIHPDRVGTPLGDEVRAMAERVGGEAFLHHNAPSSGGRTRAPGSRRSLSRRSSPSATRTC
jgi:hypothetical protein